MQSAEVENISEARVENERFEENVSIFVTSNSKATESGTAGLVQTACKVFSRGGDKMSCIMNFVILNLTM